VSALKFRACQECGGQPTVETAFWGRAYYACCSLCGWEGGLRQVESGPMAALSHWDGKFAKPAKNPQASEKQDVSN